MLHLAQPIPTDDDLLMSDDERRIFMTPVPSEYRPDDELPPARVRFPMRVRAEARKRLSAMAETEDAA